MFTSTADRFEAAVFNVYDNCARQLFELQPLDRSPISMTSPIKVHLAIIGFGKMGQAVAAHAARLGHFANSQRLRISVIDSHVEEARSAFLALYPLFGEICELEFINASAKSAEVNELLQEWASKKDALLTLAICLDYDTLNVTRALTIAKKLQRHNVPVLVRMEEDAGLASLLVCDGACHPAVNYIRPFGQIDRVCALSRLLSKEQDRRARKLHERYVANARKDPGKPSSDPTLLDWDQLPESYKDSNRKVYDHLPVKLRAIGISDEQPLTRDLTRNEVEVLARMEHARWMAERQLAGWRYAPGKKCDELMTNPSLLPWSKLDKKNKDKDREAVREMERWLKEPIRGRKA